MQYWFDCGHNDDYVYDRTLISKRELERMRGYWKKYGQVVKPNISPGGRSVILQSQNEDGLLAFLGCF